MWIVFILLTLLITGPVFGNSIATVVLEGVTIGARAVGNLIEDDFDDGNIAGWTETGGDCAPSTEQAHTVSYSVKCSTAWHTFYQDVTAQSEIWTRFYIYPVQSGWSGGSECLHFQHGATCDMMAVCASDGIVDAWNTVVPEGYAGTQTWNWDAWNLIEARLLIHATAGEFEMWVNGVQSINQTGLNTGANNIDRMNFGPLTNTNTMYFDNIGVDSTGWLGTVP